MVMWGIPVAERLTARWISLESAYRPAIMAPLGGAGELGLWGGRLSDPVRLQRGGWLFLRPPSREMSGGTTRLRQFCIYPIPPISRLFFASCPHRYFISDAVHGVGYLLAGLRVLFERGLGLGLFFNGLDGVLE